MGKAVEIFVNDKQGFKNPTTFALDAQRDQGFWINNVAGINREGELPARFPSGFLRTFTLAETIQERTKGKATFQVRVFIPSEISKLVNDIPEDVAERQISQGTHMVQQLANNHFNHVDVFIERDQPITGEAIDVLEGIARLATEVDPTLFDKIRENGRRRGGENGAKNADIYGVHHFLGWKDGEHLAFFQKQGPFTIINTMPPSEKQYVDLRQKLLARIRESEYAPLLRQGQTVDLLMMMSDRPHYLLITDSAGNTLEPTMTDAQSLTCGQMLAIFDDNLRRGSEELGAAKSMLKKARDDFGRLVTTLSRGKEGAMDAKLNELLASTS